MWRSVDACARQSLTHLNTCLESRGGVPPGHAARVSQRAMTLGAAIGVPDDDLPLLGLGAYLHDVGKATVPLSILCKPGRLTDAEYRLIQKHVSTGSSLISLLVPNLDPRVVELVLSHHERYDGNGYPCGLTADAIPVWARICCLVDAWDAMIHDRCYRGRLQPYEATAEVRRCAGTHFDPLLVEVFLDQMVGQEQKGAKLS